MGNVRPYEPHMVDSMDDVKLSDFKFKLLSVELVDGTKNKFNQKYSITLPPQIRSRYADDVVFRSEWRSLLNSFDEKFSGLHLRTAVSFGGPFNIIQGLCSLLQVTASSQHRQPQVQHHRRRERRERST